MFKCYFGHNGQPTGDPWIDAGIVGFFDYLGRGGELTQKHDVEVDFDGFMLSSSKARNIENFVRDVFEAVKNDHYIVKTNKWSLIYDQVHDILALTDKINPVRIIAELFAGGNLRPKYDKVPFPVRLLPQLYQLAVEYEGNRSVDFQTLSKDLKKACGEERTVSRGRSGPKTFIESLRKAWENDPHSVTEQLKDVKIFASDSKVCWAIHPKLVPERLGGKKTRRKTKSSTHEQCTFCGREYPASSPHSNNYPFIVATESWSNFFSQQRLELKVCSLCEVASLFAFTHIFYSLNTNRRRKFIFMAIPHAESLSEIDAFWADVRGLIGERTLTDTSNALEDAFKYIYLNETVLAFANRLYRGFSEAREGARLREETQTKIWHFYLAKKAGNVLSFDNYVTFDEMERLFRLFDEAAQIRDEQGKPVIDFPSMFTNLGIKEGDNWNNSYRETIATAVLHNHPLTEAAEAFLWKKDATVRGFKEFVKLYHIFRRGGA